MEVDPRYAMAQVYKALRGKAELTDQFTTEVNNCNRSRGASQFVLARPPRSIFI